MTTVAGISYRMVVGRRRIWLMLLLPAGLIALAVLLRLIDSADERSAVMLLQVFGVGTMLPLLGLIAGTGVIGPEIDDGTIVHLLSKPISRPAIAATKFLVASSLLAVFGAIPTFIAGYLLVRGDSGIALGFAIGAFVGGIVYVALFLLLGVVTKHAVAIGIAYALIWESVVGNFVPGARNFSIQQWAQTIAYQFNDSIFFAKPSVGTGFAVTAIVLVTVGTVVWSGQRLRSFALTGDE
ncbi:ABC transporter permease subunit [Spongiactinospora sp. TRM90649]|uniref:ABC transporter permease n=1 Tax=Spongiactinospora sp. TRM90649 TaxID=3031114 RepID=UPI0023F9F5EF|nr:ABC transporter permease subunit [Spongiactinospora sp. TRM90649]MDF5751486.1 ABC transporter permease subunit [Spongiactinospora sp. TRM90649]